MWLLAEARHKHGQAFCKWLLPNCNQCEECNMHVVLMVHIHHHIPEAKCRQHDAGAARVLNNPMRCKNQRHGTLAAAREVCNATRCMCNGSRLMLHQSVRGSVPAVSAVRNTRVFKTVTSVVAHCPTCVKLAGIHKVF